VAVLSQQAEFTGNRDVRLFAQRLLRARNPQKLGRTEACQRLTFRRNSQYLRAPVERDTLRTAFLLIAPTPRKRLVVHDPQRRGRVTYAAPFEAIAGVDVKIRGAGISDKQVASVRVKRKPWG
jgi:superfamily I DNA/RNA helicase